MQNNWSTINPSDECTRCRNPIRSFVESEVAKVKPNLNKSRINLTLGDPAGFSEFRLSSKVASVVDNNFEETQHTFDSRGPLSSRQYVANLYSTERWQLTADDVFLIMGGSCGLFYMLNTLANPGDTILAPHPGFPLMFAICENRGVECVVYKLEQGEDSNIDLTDLEEKIKKHKPKFILINNPSNPLGTVWQESHLKEVLSMANKYHTPIVSDEMYEKLVYGGSKAISTGTLSEGQPVFVISGLSKMCLAPGWRCGWIVCYGKPELIVNVKKGLATMCSMYNHPNSIAALKIPEVFDETMKILNEKAELVEKKAQLIKEKLRGFKGVRVANTKGALYLAIFLDFDQLDIESSKQLTLALLEEENVFCLPGDAFKSGNMIRLVLMSPEEEIDEFTKRFKAFLDRHTKRD